ncbi:hypothetical protein HYC85_001217 [Camellia sinensis]|uniref:2-methoxy-6-polyprenyl-1,4-benzoquinol methylase, mitochondrial n=1 Tax=Camellia sinensis TaxID=4442 RepID=A0A7J7I795_CAMSI|nr:hypothetical protein HYC85_001217 [Camellia sinensis]
MRPKAQALPALGQGGPEYGVLMHVVATLHHSVSVKMLIGNNMTPQVKISGFKDVREEEKSQMVGNVFSSVASNYDIMNDLMSAGLHRLWKDRLVSKLNPFPGMKHLDVAGGTDCRVGMKTSIVGRRETINS